MIPSEGDQWGRYNLPRYDGCWLQVPGDQKRPILDTIEQHGWCVCIYMYYVGLWYVCIYNYTYTQDFIYIYVCAYIYIYMIVYYIYIYVPAYSN